jgi:hypothetical protein
MPAASYDLSVQAAGLAGDCPPDRLFNKSAFCPDTAHYFGWLRSFRIDLFTLPKARAYRGMWLQELPAWGR